MKIILKIIVILLVAAIVAGGFSLAVNSSSSVFSTENSGAPAMTSGNQPLARPEGSDHDSGSITPGLAGVANTLMKLTGISILVLVLQKGFSQLGNQKLKLAQR